MKLFFQMMLSAVLAVPAFCQEPSPFPEPAPAASSDQVRTLTDEAARMGIQAQKMAIDVQAAADAASGLADQVFSFPDINQKLMRLDSKDIDEMKAAAMDLANDAGLAFLQAAPPTPPRPLKAADFHTARSG